MEARILRAVKLTLANVIKDTATPHGIRHPLSDGTIQDLRQCRALISARERELAQAARKATGGKPHYADDPARETGVCLSCSDARDQRAQASQARHVSCPRRQVRLPRAGSQAGLLASSCPR